MGTVAPPALEPDRTGFTFRVSQPGGYVTLHTSSTDRASEVGIVLVRDGLAHVEERGRCSEE